MQVALRPGDIYRVGDYETGKPLGTIHGPLGRLDAHFRKHLLLKAEPQ
jgi:hypothetical protein